ncbi:class I SAM-dependent methyltransferase [Priestia filamentosa]|uniref:class I SAM-dependent methyltransferase n=1 Tax=Priestia filamentosa TaxID=1402861 RepID=UPI0039824B91
MTELKEMETLFKVIDDTANILRNKLNCTYLEAVSETGENLFEKAILQEEVDDVTKKRVEKEYERVDIEKLSKESIRKAFQLAVLKGMKEATQPNHEMTPDAVSIFVGYFVQKLMDKKDEFSILDPAVGTGNLLTAILNGNSKKVRAYGSDVDELLVKLSYVNANLQHHEMEFFNQDSLQPLFVDPVDVVTVDLPVGYYPNDEGASTYRLRAEEGHSYAHYLFIEQSFRYLKEGGYLIALVPNNIFSGDEAKKLHAFIKEEGFIQGLLQLPLTMFKKEQHAKSIFIVQKKGATATPPSQALLVDLPSFSNKEAMSDIMSQINEWFTAKQ